MLERDYAMVKNGNCDYKLTVAYDPDPDGISLDEEIQSLLSEMFNIAESYNCSMEADIYEVGGQQRSWQNKSSVQIGSASCRERVCKYVKTSVGAGPIKTK